MLRITKTLVEPMTPRDGGKSGWRCEFVKHSDKAKLWVNFYFGDSTDPAHFGEVKVAELMELLK